MNFESRANFIDLSYLQVITIGLINLSSSQFSNFLICPPELSLFNSVFTESSKCKGTCLPFSWIGSSGSWKCVTFVWFFIFPMNNCLKVLDIISISFSLSGDEIKLMDLQVFLLMWSGKCFWDTSIPTFGKLSFPRRFLSGPFVKSKWHSLWDYPFEKIGKIAFPVILIALSVNPQ